MAQVYLSNKGSGIRGGNIMVKTSKCYYEIAIDAYANILCVAVAYLDMEKQTIVYRAKLSPSWFRGYCFVGTTKESPARWVKVSQNELDKIAARAFYEYCQEQINKELFGE